MAIENKKSGWSSVTLADIARQDSNGFVDGPFGSNLPAACYTKTGVPVVRGSNLSLGAEKFRDAEFVFVSEETATKLARSICVAKDIVFTKKGTLGQTGIIPRNHRFQRFLLSSNQMKLSVDNAKADSDFVYYYVSSPVSREKIIRDSESTGVPKINLTYLRTFPILLPSLPEQKRIAHILGTLDDKIELNRRMNETLEGMARALFKSWFVDFDPVRAKANGQQPPGLDAPTAALFPDSFEDSPLGLIPKGWSVAKLEDVVGVNQSSISNEYPHEIIRYIDISSVQKGTLQEPTSYKLTEAPSRAKRLVSHGDTIWSCVRPNRRSYLFIHNPEDNIVVSTGFAVLHPKELSPNFVYAWTTTEEFVDYLTANADGSAYPAVRPEHFQSAAILIPTKSVLKNFETSVSRLRDKIARNEIESKTLARIRDTLLPKLLSGEIRVTDEAAIED